MKKIRKQDSIKTTELNNKISELAEKNEEAKRHIEEKEAKINSCQLQLAKINQEVKRLTDKNKKFSCSLKEIEEAIAKILKETYDLDKVLSAKFTSNVEHNLGYDASTSSKYPMKFVKASTSHEK